MADQEMPDPELRDALVRGIHTYERRRRRRLVGGGAGIALAATLAGGLTWAGGGIEPERGTASNPSVEVGETSAPSTTPGTLDERVDVEAIDPLLPDGTDLVGTDVVLLATDGNGGGIGVADLGSNRRAIASDAMRTSGGGFAVTAGAFTDDHLWIGPPAVAAAIDGGDPVASLAEGTLDHTTVVEGARGQRGISTDSGNGLWLQSSGTQNPTVRLLDAELRSVVEVEIPGGLLVDVIGDEAVIDLSLPEGVGGVFVVSPDGSSREIARPAGARFVTATPRHTVWIQPGSGRTNELVIVDAAGAERRVSPPGGGSWSEVAHPTIPSESADLKSVTSDGSALLLGLFAPELGENSRMRGLVTVDLHRGEPSEPFMAEPGVAGELSAAFWSADDSRIVAIVGMSEGQSVMFTEPGSGSVERLGDVFPPGYFVIAAR